MMEDNNDIDEDEDVDDFDDFDDTSALEQINKRGGKTKDARLVGEPSIELNIEELIAELEADAQVLRPKEARSACKARKRLEKILEKRRMAHDLEGLDELGWDAYETTK